MVPAPSELVEYRAGVAEQVNPLRIVRGHGRTVNGLAGNVVVRAAATGILRTEDRPLRKRAERGTAIGRFAKALVRGASFRCCDGQGKSALRSEQRGDSPSAQDVSQNSLLGRVHRRPVVGRDIKDKGGIVGLGSIIRLQIIRIERRVVAGGLRLKIGTQCPAPGEVRR
jgi:hypothetical protein